MINFTQDPLEDIVEARIADTAPPLAWVIEWSAENDDPVTAAWFASRMPSRLLVLALSYLSPRAFIDAGVALLRAVLTDTYALRRVVDRLAAPKPHDDAYTYHSLAADAFGVERALPQTDLLRHHVYTAAALADVAGNALVLREIGWDQAEHSVSSLVTGLMCVMCPTPASDDLGLVEQIRAHFPAPTRAILATP